MYMNLLNQTAYLEFETEFTVFAALRTRVHFVCMVR